MIKIFFVSFSLFLISCASAPVEDRGVYAQPQASENTSVFIGEESARGILKGHEKIFVCQVDGQRVLNADLDLPVYVSSGAHTISVCYEEGLNRGIAEITADIPAGREHQIRLGEHSWTEVNLWIEQAGSEEPFSELITVPKTQSMSPLISF